MELLDKDSAVRAQDTPHLIEGLVLVLHVMEREHREGPVERAVGERDRFRASLDERDVRRASTPESDLARIGFEDNDVRPVTCEHRGKASRPTAKVDKAGARPDGQEPPKRRKVPATAKDEKYASSRRMGAKGRRGVALTMDLSAPMCRTAR